MADSFPPGSVEEDSFPPGSVAEETSPQPQAMDPEANWPWWFRTGAAATRFGGMLGVGIPAGAAGTAFGGPAVGAGAAVLGAGGGAALAETGIEFLAKAFGYTPEDQPTLSASRIGTEGLYGMAGEGLGQAAGAVVKNLPRLLKFPLKAEQKIAGAVRGAGEAIGENAPRPRPAEPLPTPKEAWEAPPGPSDPSAGPTPPPMAAAPPKPDLAVPGEARYNPELDEAFGAPTRQKVTSREAMYRPAELSRRQAPPPTTPTGEVPNSRPMATPTPPTPPRGAPTPDDIALMHAKFGEVEATYRKHADDFGEQMAQWRERNITQVPSQERDWTAINEHMPQAWTKGSERLRQMRAEKYRQVALEVEDATQGRISASKALENVAHIPHPSVADSLGVMGEAPPAPKTMGRRVEMPRSFKRTETPAGELKGRFQREVIDKEGVRQSTRDKLRMFSPGSLPPYIASAMLGVPYRTVAGVYAGTRAAHALGVAIENAPQWLPRLAEKASPALAAKIRTALQLIKDRGPQAAHGFILAMSQTPEFRQLFQQAQGQ